MTAGETRRRSLIVAILIVYAIGLGFAVFWPEPIDRNAGAFYSLVHRLIPGATYSRVEFSLNIVLFIPFGVLLALLIRRHRLAVIGLGWVASLAVEITQGTLLAARTASALDVLANTLGAAVGVVCIVAIERGATHRFTRSVARPRPLE